MSVSAPKKWRRWSGPRRELVRAADEAATELEAWSGLKAVVEVRITDSTGLSETSPGAEAIMALHEQEMRDVTSIAITVSVDVEKWLASHRQERMEAIKRGEGREQPPIGEVTIRVSDLGTSLEVRGDDRTRVAGLRQRLEEVLSRGATNVLDRDIVAVLSGVFAPLLILASLVVGKWLFQEKATSRLDPVEVISLGVGVAFAFGLVISAWWLIPTLQLFDEGGASRARRFRGAILTAVSALAVGLIGSFVYDQVT